MNKMIYGGVLMTFLAIAQQAGAQTQRHYAEPVELEQTIRQNLDNGVNKYTGIEMVYTLELNEENFERASTIINQDFQDFPTFREFYLDHTRKALVIVCQRTDNSPFMTNLEVLLNEKNIRVQKFSADNYITE